jgi:hypothetical protein
MGVFMKAYLAAYLRDRDLRGFREVLEQFTRPSYGHVRRVLMNVFGVLIPAMMEQFPSLTEREMWEMAMDRIADLDIPADLDELEGRRQRDRFRALLRDFAAQGRETPTIPRPGILENLPAFRRQFPAITVEEMRAMAEAAFGPDTVFELAEPMEKIAPVTLPPELEDVISPPLNSRTASPRAAALLRRYVGPLAPRSGGCS